MTDPRNTPLHIVAPYRTRITEREHFAFGFVQRFGSPDVLTWGQERSFKAAQHAAMQELGRRHRQLNAS